MIEEMRDPPLERVEVYRFHRRWCLIPGRAGTVGAEDHEEVRGAFSEGREHRQRRSYDVTLAIADDLAWRATNDAWLPPYRRDARRVQLPRVVVVVVPGSVVRGISRLRSGAFDTSPLCHPGNSGGRSGRGSEHAEGNAFSQASEEGDLAGQKQPSVGPRRISPACSGAAHRSATTAIRWNSITSSRCRRVVRMTLTISSR